MFVCKLRTPSCSHYEHFHVYLAYRRQTGNVVTRQTFDRAPRLTRPPTAHISKGESGENSHVRRNTYSETCLNGRHIGHIREVLLYGPSVH